MATTDTVKVSFTDNSGDVATASFSVLPAATDGDIEALIDEMQALSDLKIFQWARVIEHSYADATGPEALGTGNAFADDKAQLVLKFHSANPKQVITASIPGPIEDAITKNDLSADLTQTQVAAACTALATFLTTREGEAATTPKEGFMRIFRGKRAAK